MLAGDLCLVPKIKKVQQEDGKILGLCPVHQQFVTGTGRFQGHAAIGWKRLRQTRNGSAFISADLPRILL